MSPCPSASVDLSCFLDALGSDKVVLVDSPDSSQTDCQRDRYRARLSRLPPGSVAARTRLQPRTAALPSTARCE